MYNRTVGQFIRSVAPKYPIVTILGPRQSGKSTLSRNLFSKYQYVSLETPHDRELAQTDPLGFFNRYQGSLIIDEVQQVPQLLSYLQTFVDDPKNKNQYVLTGSQQFLFMEKVTQTLAGRTVIIKLLPFSLHEIRQQDPSLDLDNLIYTGGYPRIYDKTLNPTQWMQQYYQTYVERDVRQLIQVNQLSLFQKFMGLCAGRVGSLLNYASLGDDCGITDPTVKSWLSVLQTSFICLTLQPHFKNFNKRLIKSPKLYFYDTGLLCYLLKIFKKQDLENHPLRGAIFENFVIVERIKQILNKGKEPNLYFWRDTKGHEVDLVEDKGTYLFPTEIKSAMTFQPQFVKNLDYLNKLQGMTTDQKWQGEVVYGGQDSFEYKGYNVVSWDSSEYK